MKLEVTRQLGPLQRPGCRGEAEERRFLADVRGQNQKSATKEMPTPDLEGQCSFI